MDSFAARFKQTQSQPIHLIRAEDGEGEKCYYFIQCDDLKFRLLCEHQAEIVGLERYCTILRMGYGDTPSAADWQYMQRHHGFTNASHE